MRRAPPLSTTRPRNTRPARCVTRRFTGRMSTRRCSNRGPAMTTSDWEESKGIGGTGAGNGAAAKQAIAAARLRSYWMRLLILGLAVNVAGSAKAQEQQWDQTPIQ